ncbi:hypothetical protein Pse7367_3955 (plasmid) [Thalassoporum mexicanum PCC 7367]|uniref:hypothetical protein n=1 Tax=Thalassoporum mexicanum TaxID=3457544 RepID=UPI00029F88D0|nr:hypothetical protein [Pseudanabaena sp. PCC 7367]AFY72170.1 hypothetical protein Pse7367_3955 [Pseudanabaena sp. PCC 7367]
MAIQIAAKPIKITIGSDNQDWSNRLISLTLRYAYLPLHGMIQTLGTLKLNASDLPSPIESMNPLANISRWHRGQTVKIQFTNDAGSFSPHPMANPLYILREPIRPFFADQPPTLELELGCILALRDFPQPDGDFAGIVAGTSISLTTVITNLLNAAEISNLDSPSFTELNGISRTAPAIKTNRKSLVQQAGELAYGAGYYLYQDATGKVAARAIDLEPTEIDFIIEVGNNAGQELLYQPLGGVSETPVEVVRVSGVAYDATPPPVTETPYYDETFEIEGIIGEIIPDSTVFFAKTITQSTRIRKEAISSEGNQEVDIIDVSFPRGLIDPADADPLSLILSRTTTITRTYDSSDRLVQILTEIDELKGLINSAEVADRFTMTNAVIETTQNIFEAAETTVQTDEMSRQITTKQQARVITNPDELVDPYGLHVAEKTIRQWSRIGETEQYGFIETPQKSKILIVANEIEDPYGLTFAPGGLVGASFDDRYLPPQAEYRTPISTITETEVSGVAYFDLSTGYERERSYRFDYIPDHATARAIAQRLGKWLVMARYAYEVGFALTNDVMDNLKPLMRSDWTEPNGNVVAYVLNGIALAYENGRAYGIAHAYPINPGIYTELKKLAANVTAGTEMSAVFEQNLRLKANITAGTELTVSFPVDRALAATITAGTELVASFPL